MSPAGAESSNNSFMKSMFFGQIREDLIFPYPHADADLQETVRMVSDTARKFAADQVQSEKWDEEGKMPIEVVKQLGELGLMGMLVPEEYGGLGLPQSGAFFVMQELAQIDSSLGITLGAHQSIGYKALLLFGSDDQKKQFLPRLASGELIAAYCLTEPGSGSDAASIQTKATLSPDGSHYVLSGSKLWITNGGIASFLTVFAKTEVEVDGQKKEKVTCFALELPAEGVEIGPEEDKLGLRASWTNAIHFDQVRVPAENVIGGVGKGFKVAMGVLNHGRLGLASGCIGGAKQCLEASSRHASERVQFQKKLIEFEMIQDKIATMSADLFAAESMVFMTTSLLDRGDVDYSLESAISKVFATEMLWNAVDENLQIWGGAGYMKEYPYERWLRDARINRIFEGTNEVLRAFIALSGMQGPGQELAGLADAIRYPLKGLGQVTGFAMRKIKRSFVGESMNRPHPSLKKMAAIVEDFASQLANKTETALRRHGKKIFLRQFIQKRIADISIDLYAMSCILSRVTAAIEKKGSPDQCELELALADCFFKRATRRTRENFLALDQNGDESLTFIAEAISKEGHYPLQV